MIDTKGKKRKKRDSSQKKSTWLKKHAYMKGGALKKSI